MRVIQHRSYDPAEYAAERRPGTWYTWVLWGSVVAADASWMYLHGTRTHEPWLSTAEVHHVLTVAAGALWVKLWMDVRVARRGGR